MLTFDETQQLLKAPKRVKGTGYIDLSKPKQRLYLVLHDAPKEKITLFLEITESAKRRYKISLHFQENNSNTGLLRVDFGGRHRNPSEITSNVPVLLQSFVDQWLDTPHIHFNVEGFPTLVWALPLTAYPEFVTKEINSSNDFKQAILNFASEINLVNTLTFEENIFA